MIRRITVCCLLLLAAAMPAAGGGDDEGVRVTRSQARKLVQKWAASTGTEKDDARDALRAVRDADHGLVFDSFARGVFEPDARHAKIPRIHDITVAFEGGAMSEGRFRVQLPNKYAGKKPWPLLFRFHGSGGNGVSFSRGWMLSPFAQKFITVTPTIPTEDRGGWKYQGVRNFFLEAYAYMVSRYNVDTDRVYFSGFSAGGGAAFYYTQSWPHLAAAVCARGRLWWNHTQKLDECMAILEHVPVYFAVGLDDAKDRVAGFRRAEKFFEKNKFEAVYRFVEGRGHQYMHELDKEAFDFLLEHERVKYPREFNGFYFSRSNLPEEEPFLTEQYWLKALKYNTLGTTCRVSVKKNHIAIAAPGLREARLHLNDAIVDLDEPVTVTLNDAEVFNGRVERSMDFLLDWYDKNKDPRRLFWNAVTIAAEPKGAGR